MEKLRHTAAALNAIFLVVGLFVQAQPDPPPDSPPPLLDVIFGFLTIVVPLVSLFVLSDRRKTNRQTTRKH